MIVNNYQRKTKFITFGGPTNNFHNRVNELCYQASLIPTLFSEIKGFTDNDLKKDEYFWKKHGDFIESNQRGYGYWLWKPYLIKKSLETMDEGDILVYADAGCHLNLNALSIKRLNEYYEIVDNSPFGILSFQMEHLPEYKYNKYETIESVIGNIDTLDNQSIIKSGQCMATIIIMRKTPYTVGLIDEWFRKCEIYNLINDRKGQKQLNGFIDHRHDQSIYSLLVKKNGSYLIKDETFFHPNWKKDGANFPFWAIRNKGI